MKKKHAPLFGYLHAVPVPSEHRPGLTPHPMSEIPRIDPIEYLLARKFGNADVGSSKKASLKRRPS
jgi:hypothetical protein